MAIRFVDVEPETGKGGTKPKPAKAAVQPTAPTPEPVEEAIPALPLAKPEPKVRGRKKPAGEPQTAEAAGDASSAEALLPGLQAHAKPTPKPRGRKKAFG